MGNGRADPDTYSPAIIFPPNSSLNTKNMNTNTSTQLESPTASTSTSHTPALSLSHALTHPALSPPHTLPLELEEDGEDTDATGLPEPIEDDECSTA